MKITKKLTALLLALLTVASLAAATVSFAEEKASGDTSEEPLPSYSTLVGTPTLPPVSNQGEVGSCASNAITYVQYTNCIAQYIRHQDPDTDWNPSSGDPRYIFAPKFTYQYSGAGTAWVYDILMDHGCLTLADCNFATDENGASLVHVPNRKSKIEPKSASFELGEGMLEKAMQYRLTGYEQVWLTSSYLVDGKVAVTTTPRGQQLLHKIKAAVAEGNAVVTGGYPSRWKFSDDMKLRLKNKGNLAQRATEAAIVYSSGEDSGGHQVCIVGYDDNIEVEVNGVTLKGAFQVVNSWGDGWKNDGYTWLMYDALNEVSEFDELNVPGRGWAMDQMVFTYWDEDVTTDKPDLYLQVEAETNNRDGAAVSILRKEEGKQEPSKFYPMMFNYGPVNRNMHSTFDSKDTFTVSGEPFKADSPLEKVYYTLDFNAVSSTAVNTGAISPAKALRIPNLKSFSDYTWGVGLYGCLSATTIYHSVKLVTQSGVVLAELDLGPDGFTAPKSQLAKPENFFFDLDGVVDTALPSPGKDDHYTLERVSGDRFQRDGGSYTFKILPEEGYTADDAVVSYAGETLKPDKDGVYTVTVNAAKNTVDVPSEEGLKRSSLTISGVVEGTPGESGGSLGSNSTIVIIVVAAICVIAVAIIVCVIVSKNKKKKKATVDGDSTEEPKDKKLGDK